MAGPTKIEVKDVVVVKEPPRTCCWFIWLSLFTLVLLIIIPVITWYAIHQDCYKVATNDVCGHGTMVYINTTLFYCECHACYTFADDGRCNYEKKYYALAAVLQTMPLPGIFGAGYAYIGQWTFFTFQCILTCLMTLPLIGLCKTTGEPDGQVVQTLMFAILLGGASFLWWLVSWCLFWSNYYVDGNGIALYKK